MKVLLAPDSFKGSLSALRFCEVAEGALGRACPEVEVVSVPMSDGGEGMVEVLVHHTDGELLEVVVEDPLGRSVKACLGILGGGNQGVVELAAASGLGWLADAERDPGMTSTFGTGQLILEALERGCQEILLGVGGSATSDGGKDALSALGFRFLDSQGRELPRGGAALAHLDRISTELVPRALRDIRVVLACDVTNPLLGPEGASATFGPQKGATEAMVEELDRALASFARVISRQLGVANLETLPGGGAAGGAAVGFSALLGAELRPGFEVVAEVVGLAELLDRERPDLVITGEGGLDAQTACGKLPAGIAGLASERGIACVALAGSVDQNIETLDAMGMTAAFSIVPGPTTLATSMEEGEDLLASSIVQVVRLAARLAP